MTARWTVKLKKIARLKKKEAIPRHVRESRDIGVKLRWSTATQARWLAEQNRKRSSAA